VKKYAHTLKDELVTGNFSSFFAVNLARWWIMILELTSKNLTKKPISRAKRQRIIRLGIILALLIWPETAFAKDVAFSFNSADKVKVMTLNLYLGTDLFKLQNMNPSKPWEIMTEIGDRVIEMVATDFPSRAKRLAEEIGRYEPDLIGLQEVNLIRLQFPGDFLLGNPEPADWVLYDYLAILLKALKEQGMVYNVAVSQENIDIEVPAVVSREGIGNFSFDVRLTDRDVILARSGVTISNTTMRHYTNNLLIRFGGFSLKVPKGFEAVDAVIDGRTYRFVNTHLEVKEMDEGVTQTLQAQELVDELEQQTLPVILVGDFNSGPTDQGMSPYFILSEAGFIDTWKLRGCGAADPGYTCCQAADLSNTDSELSERIDIVWLRNNLGFLPYSVIGRTEAQVVGNLPEDRTPSGLWPSDHAGVVTELEIPMVSPLSHGLLEYQLR